MKTLLTAVIALGISGAALAQNEVPEDTIPGYTVTVMPASSQQQAAFEVDSSNEPMAYSVPGYGVTASSGRVYSQTEIGSAEEDFLSLVEGNE